MRIKSKQKLFTIHQHKKQFVKIFKTNSSMLRTWSNEVNYYRAMGYDDFLCGIADIIKELSLKQLINLKERSIKAKEIY